MQTVIATTQYNTQESQISASEKSFSTLKDLFAFNIEAKPECFEDIITKINSAENVSIHSRDEAGKTLLFFVQSPKLARFIIENYNVDFTVRSYKEKKTAAETVTNEEVRKLFSKEEDEQMLRRLEDAGRMYLSLERNNKQTTRELSNILIQNRTLDPQTPQKSKKSPSISIGNYSRRALVAGDSTHRNISASIPEEDKKNIKTHKEFLRVYNLKPFHVDYMEILPSQNDEESPVIISSGGRPFREHEGNCDVYGLGSYDKIAKTLNQMLSNDGEKERKFFSWLLNNQGKAITWNDFLKLDLEFPEDKEHLKALFIFVNRFILLTWIKEPSRRMKENIKPDRISGAHIAGALCLVLVMLSKGNLKHDDVFKNNAPYGVATGKKISSEEGQKKAKATLLRIIKLYNELYPEEKFSREFVRQRLKETYGGGDESDGDGEDYKDTPEKKRSSPLKRKVEFEEDEPSLKKKDKNLTNLCKVLVFEDKSVNNPPKHESISTPEKLLTRKGFFPMGKIIKENDLTRGKENYPRNL